MKTGFVALCALSSCLFVGCARDPQPPSDLNIILPNGARIYKQDDGAPARLTWGGEADASPASTVRGGGLPKAYPMGRTVDANGIMHEAHVAYRMESVPRWWLDANATDRVIIGPMLGERPASLHPSAIDAELARQVTQRDEVSKKMLEAAERQLAMSRKLGEKADTISADRDAAVAALEMATKRIRELDAEKRELKAENAKLKDAPPAYKGDQ